MLINKKLIIIIILLLFTFSQKVKGEQFQPLGLEDCIKISLENNPSIDLAKTKVRIATTKVQEILSEKYPKIKVGGGISKYDYQSGKQDVTLSEPIPSISNFPQINLSRDALDGEFAVGIEQMIYDGGRTDIKVITAKIEEENSRIDLLKIEQEAIYNTKITYYSSLKNKEKFNLSNQNIKSVEEHLKLAKYLFQLGMVPEVDSITAEVALEKAKMFQNQLQNEYKKSLGALKSAMGIDINGEIEISDDKTYKKINIDEKLAVEKALENRPETKQIDNLSRAKDNINVGETVFAPTISASTGYIIKNPDAMGNRNFYFQLGVNFPVFSIGAYGAQEERAKATLEEFEKEKEIVRNKIKLEVQNSLLDLKSAQTSIEITLKGVELASMGLKISEGKYKEGIGTIIELTDAQINYFKANTDYYDSLYNYKIALASAEHAIGVKIEEIEMKEDK